MTRNTHRRLIFAAILLLGACALATGCGRKGPLYLPGGAAPAQSAAPSQPRSLSEEEAARKAAEKTDRDKNKIK